MRIIFKKINFTHRRDPMTKKKRTLSKIFLVPRIPRLQQYLPNWIKVAEFVIVWVTVVAGHRSILSLVYAYAQGFPGYTDHVSYTTQESVCLSVSLSIYLSISYTPTLTQACKMAKFKHTRMRTRNIISSKTAQEKNATMGVTSTVANY